MKDWLDFEKPAAALADSAAALRAAGTPEALSEAPKLDERAQRLLADLYGRLTPVQRMQVARHPARPHFKDYVAGLTDDFLPLSGDRNFGEDQAILGGLATIDGRKVVLLGHEKGDDTASRLRHNFGMAKPEGYRKAIRLMDLAHRFNLPVITLVDTPGAYPGKGAEERGQSEAIARCTQKCLEIGVPLVSVIIGEGGSGGAVAFATADRVAMLEHSIYSVISPEGCASILWKDAEKMREAAEALKLTAQDLKKLGVIDSIIPEPLGGAQRERDEAIRAVGDEVARLLSELQGRKPAELIRDRRQKYLDMGARGLAA